MPDFTLKQEHQNSNEKGKSNSFVDSKEDEGAQDINGHFEGHSQSSHSLNTHNLRLFQQQTGQTSLIMQDFITDVVDVVMLIESRIQLAIKRNVLRDTISEDLEWAQCIKNENEEFERLKYNKPNFQETRSMHSTPERKIEDYDKREKSCDRIFGSASSRRRFKKSSRINSRRSSISSKMELHKSKSKDNLSQNRSTILLESKSLQMLNKDIQHSRTKRIRDSSRSSYDSHRQIGR